MKKIAICGFAPSYTDGPYGDASWEIWGVNDLHLRIPRCDVIFEVHHLDGLDYRRNPQHFQILKTTPRPIWMVDPRPDMPSARRLPVQELTQRFPRAYWTNSIAYMIAMAILEVMNDAPWNPDSNPDKKGEIGLWGIDMAAMSEYAAQRPSCEYFVGIADGLGIPVHIPANSDLLKTTAVYGLSSTEPLRVKAASELKQAKAAKAQINQSIAQLQMQIQQAQSQLDQHRGRQMVWEYIQGVWTMPTDRHQEITEPVQRPEPMVGSPMVEHVGNGETHLVLTNAVQGDQG